MRDVQGFGRKRSAVGMPRPKKAKVEVPKCLGPATTTASTGTTDVEEGSTSTVAEQAGRTHEGALEASSKEAQLRTQPARSARLVCGSATAQRIRCSARGRWAGLWRLVSRGRPDMGCLPVLWCVGTRHRAVCTIPCASGGLLDVDSRVLGELRAGVCGSRPAAAAVRIASGERV